MIVVEVKKVEMCGSPNYYQGMNSARMALQNHQRNGACDCEIEDVELGDKEWLCTSCRDITDEIECPSCGMWRHSLSAVPNTELAQEEMRIRVLEDYDMEHKVDEEVLRNARGVTVTEEGIEFEGDR